MFAYKRIMFLASQVSPQLIATTKLDLCVAKLYGAVLKRFHVI